MSPTTRVAGDDRRWCPPAESVLMPGDGALAVALRAGEVWASGDIDSASAPLLAEALAPMIARGGVVRIDAHRVTFMDAAGAHVLADTAKAIGSGGRLVLLRPSRPVTRVLEILGIEHCMDVEIPPDRHRRGTTDSVPPALVRPADRNKLHRNGADPPP